MAEDEEIVSGRDAAEDYRRQRQRAAFGSQELAEAARRALADAGSSRGRLLEMARTYARTEAEAQALTDEVLRVPTEHLSALDEPFGHRILSELLSQVADICSRGSIPMREGAVLGVSPATGLHAYQSEVPRTGASIIDFAMPFVMFCNQFAILITRTLPHVRTESGFSVNCDPEETRKVLAGDASLTRTWAQFTARFAIEGWPIALDRTAVDGERVATRLQILSAMELFAVAHEYAHHVLLHGATDTSVPTGDPMQMEHDADGFARMVSMTIGTNEDPPNSFATTGAGGVLMLGALEIVRRARHVLTAGDTQFPPRETHPPFERRIGHIGTFDRYAPAEYAPEFAAMRADLLGVVDTIWGAIEPMFLGMHHEVGIKLDAPERGRLDWLSLT